MSNEIIPKGIYRALPLELELGTASTGAEQVAVRFELLSGGQEGKRIVWYGFFTEKTAERTIESLRHMGWKGVDLSDLSTAKEECSIVVDHEQDKDGNFFARVKWVNAAGGPMMKNIMDDSAKKAFALRMRALAAATTGQQGPRAKPNGQTGGRPPEPPPHTDADGPGDIPF